MPYNTTSSETQVRPLTKLQLAYVQSRSRGGQKDRRLDKLPQVQEAIAELQRHARAVWVYDLSAAMSDCDKAADLAFAKNNPMALVKAFELKAKLAGLLIEKHEVLTVSLKEALDLARARADQRKQIVEAQPQAQAHIRENGPASPASTVIPTTCE